MTTMPSAVASPSLLMAAGMLAAVLEPASCNAGLIEKNSSQLRLQWSVPGMCLGLAKRIETAVQGGRQDKGRRALWHAAHAITETG